MMRSIQNRFAIILLLCALGIFSSVGVTNAYSVSDSTPNNPSLPNYASNGTGFDQLFAPFKNFVNSINSVGPATVPVKTPPMLTQNSFYDMGLRNLFQQFDAWLYGIAGFHIATFFTAILNILSWLLGIVKGGVDWLLGWLH